MRARGSRRRSSARTCLPAAFHQPGEPHLGGQHFTNDAVSVAFLALAAGSIVYVVIELLAVGRRMAAKKITTWGLLAGLLTDTVVTAAGA